MLTLDRNHRFQEYRFHDLLTLAEAAEKLGKRALELGLISSLTVYLFPDCWHFSLTDDRESELLTAECGHRRHRRFTAV